MIHQLILVRKDFTMQKHFIWIIVLFITSPIFSQTDIYDINQAHPKSTELMFQYPPVSIRERLQLPIPNIDYLKEIEHIKVDNWIPLEFFTKMTAEDSGLVISYTTHLWDDSTQAWNSEPNNREITTYDSNQNETEFLWQDWDGYDWVNNFRTFHTYDSSGILTEFLWQDWDGADWNDSSWKLYSYDFNGYLIEILWQDWDGADWINYSLEFYTNDSSGILTESLWQLWDGTDWVNGSKTFYMYDSNENLTEWLFQSWNFSNWQNSSLFLFTYDLNGFQTELLIQNWVSTEWENGALYLYTYHLNGTFTEWTLQFWDGTDWENFLWLLYTYDSNETLTEWISQLWDGTDWYNSGITYVDFSNIIASVVNDIIPAGYFLEQNYPNPFNPATTLEYTLQNSGEVSLIIYNLLGQEAVKLINEVQQAGHHEVTWNAYDFASGIYFYRLQAGDFVQTRKMVLLK